MFEAVVRDKNSRLANMSRFFVAHLVLSIIIAHVTAGSDSQECPPNSELHQCGTLCESTCRKPEIVHCNPVDPDKTCKEGCRCCDGFVRDERSGGCMKQSECPDSHPNTTTTTEKPDCPNNEIMDLCGRMCEPTCANKKPNTLLCPRIQCTKFTEGCRCKNGTYRDKSGKCCSDCPDDHSTTTTEKTITRKPITHKPITDKPITHKSTPKPDCGRNESLSDCGKTCEPKCSLKTPNPPLCSWLLNHCPKYDRGCRCDDGYYRDGSGGCVLEKDCPQTTTTEKPITPKPDCGRNESLSDCGKTCEPKCSLKTPNPPLCSWLLNHCPKYDQGCRCDDGYYRDRSGGCVLEKDCPQTTTTEKPTTPMPTPKPNCSCNETMDPCGSLCEPTCAHRIPNTRPCLFLVCRESNKGCRCKNGYYRNDLNKCVLRENCPVVPTKPPCGVNEEIGPCGSLCDGTCKNPVNGRCKEEIVCLVPGCQCKKGYVRDEKTHKCIPLGKCPDKKCGYGEIYATCGKICEGTCDAPYKPLACSRLFCDTEGCQCDLANGMVRNKITGKCTLTKDCPPGKPTID